MTRLAISRKDNGAYAIFGAGYPIASMSPDSAMQRVDRALLWLLGQEPPHEIILDDQTGVGAALCVAWLMTNAYACNVTLRREDGMPICTVGIWDTGHAFVTAYSTEGNRGVQEAHQTASAGNANAPKKQ